MNRHTMRQALIRAADQFEVVEVPPPSTANEGEIILQTAACGICSGDLMPWYLAKKVGTVLGHEPAGWAVDVGRSVSHIKPGDLVFVHHHAPCLTCADCLREAFVHCRTWRSSKIDPGGMAEFIRVPPEIVRADCFAVNDLTPEQALFIEPLGCSVKALTRLPKVAHQTGVIVGCGVMGLLNLMTARALGAETLFAVEPDADRRRLAESISSGVRALTPAEAEQTLSHQADFVVIGPGHPDVIRQALNYVRPGGSASLFTPTATGVLTSLDLGELYFREVSLIPSYSCGPTDTKLAYELLRTGQVDPRPTITHRFPLVEVQRAFDTARRGGSAVKVIVTLSESLEENRR
jgi:L-iditol 2-dehydrogenase